MSKTRSTPATSSNETNLPLSPHTHRSPNKTPLTAALITPPPSNRFFDLPNTSPIPIAYPSSPRTNRSTTPQKTPPAIPIESSHSPRTNRFFDLFPFLLLILLAPAPCWGQSILVPAGESRRTARAQVSYSVGQPISLSCEWDVFRVNGGVQQVYCQPSDTLLKAQSSYSYQWNGLQLTRSGLYTDTLLNRSGCDSLLSLDLTIINSPLPQIVTYNRRVVLVNHYPNGTDSHYVEYSRYRWYHNDVLVAEGPIDKYHLSDYPFLHGTFRVEVPVDSAAQRWVYSNTLNMDALQQHPPASPTLPIQVIPNPVAAGQKATVQLPESITKAQLTLYDQSGRQLLQRTITTPSATLESNLPPSVYSLQVLTPDGQKGVSRIVVE